MRILFCNYTFPGRLGPLAEYFASIGGNEVLFASCYGRREFSIPKVKRVTTRLRHDRGRDADALVQEWNGAFSLARQMNSTFGHVRAAGYVPDIILYSSMNGPALLLKDVFPEAFIVGYLDSYQLNEGKGSLYIGRALALQHIVGSDCAFAFSEAQRALCPPMLRGAIDIVKPSVDTQFFSPAEAGPFVWDGLEFSSGTEYVTFSLKESDESKRRELYPVIAAMLAVRKECHAVLICSGEGDASRVPAIFAQLPDQIKERIHAVPYLGLAEYRNMLCAAAMNVAPFGGGLFSYVLESMSCGAVTMAALSEHTQGILRDGVNVIGWPEEGREARFRALMRVLNARTRLRGLRLRARAAVTEEFDRALVIPPHAEDILRRREAWLSAK